MTRPTPADLARCRSCKRRRRESCDVCSRPACVECDHCYGCKRIVCQPCVDSRGHYLDGAHLAPGVDGKEPAAQEGA